MLLGPIFETFIRQSPLSVMARAAVEHALSAPALDELFREHADRGYERELLFSTAVELMSLVVCGTAPHVSSAYNLIRERVPVSLKCVYEKLGRLEPGVSAQLVRHVSGRCEALIDQMGGGGTAPLPGYRVRVLDGNHLAATQRRLKVTRGRSAAPLPGLCLAVLDPRLMLITDLIPCEDGHAQERALLGQVVPLAGEKDVWIGDRNFCTCDFLAGLQARQAHFLVRRHGNMAIEPQGPAGEEVETATGWASERAVWVCRDGQPLLAARSVRVRLKKPTEDGDREVEILTDLPAEKAGAAEVAGLYLGRWQIERAFLELTTALNCEIETLGYPRAALFAFAVAVAAYNVLAALKGALRAKYGDAKVRVEVSGYFMGLEGL